MLKETEDFVIKAPDWLVKRMEKIKKLPPLTLEEVRTQMKASEEFRKKNFGI